MDKFRFVTAILGIISLFSAMIYCIYKEHIWEAIFFGIIVWIVIDLTQCNIDDEYDEKIEEYNAEISRYNEEIERRNNEDLED